MKRFLLLATLGLTLAAQAAPLPKPKLYTLRKTEKGRFDLRVTYPRWRTKSPVAQNANFLWRARAYKLWFHINNQTRKQFADTPANWKPAAGPNYYFLQPTVSLANAKLISGYYYAHFFDGGFHPNYETYSLNVGLVNGQPKLLSLYDICQSGKTKAVAQKVWNRLRAIPNADWVQPRSQTLTPTSPILTQTWVATKTGLLFIFDPYEVGSYASGEVRVKIPYSDLKDELDANGPLEELL